MLRMRKIVSLLLATIAVPLSTFCSTLSQDDIMFSATCHNLSNILPKIRTAGNVVFDDEANEFLDYVFDFLSNNECGLSLNDPIGMYLFHDKDDDNDVERSFSALCVAKISDREIVDGPLSSQFFTKTINEWVIFSDDEHAVENDKLNAYIIRDIKAQPSHDFLIKIYKNFIKKYWSEIKKAIPMMSEMPEEQRSIILNTIKSAEPQINDGKGIYIAADFKDDGLVIQSIISTKKGTKTNALVSNLSHRKFAFFLPTIDDDIMYAGQECLPNDKTIWELSNTCDKNIQNEFYQYWLRHCQFLSKIGKSLNYPPLKEDGLIITSSGETYAYLIPDHDCIKSFKARLETIAGRNSTNNSSSQWTMAHSKSTTDDGMSNWIACNNDVILLFIGNNGKEALSKWMSSAEKWQSTAQKGVVFAGDFELSYLVQNPYFEEIGITREIFNDCSTIVNVIWQCTGDGTMRANITIPYDTMHNIYIVMTDIAAQYSDDSIDDDCEDLSKDDFDNQDEEYNDEDDCNDSGNNN